MGDRVASDIMRAVAPKTKPEWAPALLLVLLAGFLALAAAPDDRASTRVAGMSLLWWYGGVVGPVLAAAVAVLRPGPPGDPSGQAPRSPSRSTR